MSEVNNAKQLVGKVFVFGNFKIVVDKVTKNKAIITEYLGKITHTHEHVSTSNIKNISCITHEVLMDYINHKKIVYEYLSSSNKIDYDSCPLEYHTQLKSLKNLKEQIENFYSTYTSSEIVKSIEVFNTSCLITYYNNKTIEIIFRGLNSDLFIKSNIDSNILSIDDYDMLNELFCVATKTNSYFEINKLFNAYSIAKNQMDLYTVYKKTNEDISQEEYDSMFEFVRSSVIGDQLNINLSTIGEYDRIAKLYRPTSKKIDLSIFSYCHANNTELIEYEDFIIGAQHDITGSVERFKTPINILK